MRLKLNILLITLLALLSCAKEGGGRVDYGPETGNLCVRFDVSDMNPPILGVTQDNADAGHVLSEDGVMREGRMWLVDKADTADAMAIRIAFNLRTDYFRKRRLHRVPMQDKFEMEDRHRTPLTDMYVMDIVRFEDAAIKTLPPMQAKTYKTGGLPV